jgi:thymidylate synthase ThyX
MGLFSGRGERPVSSPKDALYHRRIYPLSPRNLTEEQLAVVFAMTSRRPEAFDDIARQVTQEKAADFHERWVLGYGHASVAEHAVLHMAVENVSRLAADTLEDNRLASYTEKSSRYQVLPPGYYHVPAELDQHPTLKELYLQTCDGLFAAYEELMDGVHAHLREVKPQREKERDPTYALRLRREATDSCRFILPAATLTNVGVTINARSLEHAISKLLSSEVAEERDLGQELMDKSREITPTLIKYAAPNPYLASVRKVGLPDQVLGQAEDGPGQCNIEARLVHHDSEADLKLAAAIMYRYSNAPYQEAWRKAQDLGPEGRGKLIGTCLEDLGPHGAPLREFELVDYTFDLVMDYGAYREFKRHRMQSYISQPLTVAHGVLIPELVREAGLEDRFNGVVTQAKGAFYELYKALPNIAPYVVTHAHKRRILTKLNLRECYHLFKLRTQPQAHFSIRLVMNQALRLAVEAHPQLFRHLPLRDFPDWWPFPKSKDC